MADIISPFHLPPFGDLSYGSYVFSGAANTIGFTVTPQRDQAGRTVVFSKYRMVVEDYLLGDTPAEADALAKAAISQLTNPAYTLLVGSKALSPVSVNDPGSELTDAQWGPWGVSCELATLGPVASKLTWTCEWSMATCGDANYTGPYEFNFNLTFAIDKSGYTTRTYAGHIKIAVTRPSPSSRKIIDNADNYREQCVPPLLTGFRRTSQSYELDEAKTTLNFRVVDEEIAGNYPPQGVIECSANHTYTTQNSWVRWLGTLTAEYEVVRGKTIGNAVAAFRRLLNQRMAYAKENMILGKGIPNAAVGGAVKPIPWSFEVEEPSIYGKLKARFRCSYTFTGVSLDQVIQNGGLWLPVGTAGGGEDGPGTYNTYAATVAGPRGYAGLAFRSSDDGIVDLCGPVPSIVTYTAREPGAPSYFPMPGYPTPSGSPTIPVGVPPGLTYPSSQQNQQFNSQSFFGQDTGVFTAPTQQGSWIMYECDVAIVLDTGTVVGKLLPQTPLSGQGNSQSQNSQSQNNTTWDVMQGVTNGANQTSPFPALASLFAQSLAASDTFVQQRTTPSMFIILSGRALRAGWSIPTPSLVQVNGVTPTLINQPSDGVAFRTGIVRNCGVPVAAAEWRLVYAVTAPFTGPVPLPPNPALA